MQACRRVSAFQCHRPPASIALCSRRQRFAVAQGVQRRDLGPEIAGIWRMSVYTNWFAFVGEDYHRCGAPFSRQPPVAARRALRWPGRSGSVERLGRRRLAAGHIEASIVRIAVSAQSSSAAGIARAVDPKRSSHRHRLPGRTLSQTRSRPPGFMIDFGHSENATH